jgi:spiro-SPASM protein
MKTDINSFEIETVLAATDWRLYRFRFECSSKRGLMSCKALWPVDGKSAEELSAAASVCPAIVQTVPSFYTVQIEGGCDGTCACCPYPSACMKKYGKPPAELAVRMQPEDFGRLMKAVSSFSEQAVVALSAWGEPTRHPRFPDFVENVLAEPDLSVLVETTGTEITEEWCRKIAATVEKYPERISGASRITWIVSLDATDAVLYGKMHGYDTATAERKFDAALTAVSLLQKFFPGSVYPQFLRTTANEVQLEKFFRFWNEKQSPSGGKLIIQKYDDFAKSLPPEKPADLSPLVRTPCWHIRRDMTILADGSVPYCREWILDGSVGNVFTESLESVWKKIRPLVEAHINRTYSDKCRVCDEYYTFNF